MLGGLVVVSLVVVGSVVVGVVVGLVVMSVVVGLVVMSLVVGLVVVGVVGLVDWSLEEFDFFFLLGAAEPVLYSVEESSLVGLVGSVGVVASGEEFQFFFLAEPALDSVEEARGGGGLVGSVVMVMVVAVVVGSVVVVAVVVGSVFLLEVNCYE